MKICFLLNDIAVEKPETSVFILKKAHERGHEVYIMNVGDFVFSSENTISVHAIKLPESLHKDTPEEFWEVVQNDNLERATKHITEMDVLYIRNNPTDEEGDRHWAEHAGIAFGRMVQQLGVLVLNDAYALSHAFIDKLYFEELPEDIKPKSLISRDVKDIMEFYEKVNHRIVLKPLEGSGGQDVYMIDENEKNTNQIIETIRQQGYIIAQEFLPDVSEGDVRVFLMNGQVMTEDGHMALIRRKNSGDEFRSNLSLGADPLSSELTEDMQRIINLTAPILIRDGLFLVGLDIVKDKLIEINVLSPGGLERFKDIDMPDFTDTIISAIERKVEYKKMYKGLLSNKTLATLH